MLRREANPPSIPFVKGDEIKSNTGAYFEED
jgi:hypothetical protein